MAHAIEGKPTTCPDGLVCALQMPLQSVILRCKEPRNPRAALNWWGAASAQFVGNETNGGGSP